MTGWGADMSSVGGLGGGLSFSCELGWRDGRKDERVANMAVDENGFEFVDQTDAVHVSTTAKSVNLRHKFSE